jgi:hypothetical protein
MHNMVGRDTNAISKVWVLTETEQQSEEDKANNKETSSGNDGFPSIRYYKNNNIRSAVTQRLFVYWDK